MTATFQIRRGRWPEFAEPCAQLRRQVFFNEAQYSYFATLDGRDEQCQHVLALDAQQQPIGCGRIDREWQLSRIAVVRDFRQQGVGTSLLNELIAIARDDNAGLVSCAVPLFSVQYYRSQQFEPIGSVYVEQGVSYQRMLLRLHADTGREAANR